MRRRACSGGTTEAILNDCCRMAKDPELRQYIRNVVVGLRYPEIEREHVAELLALGQGLLRLSWRWHDRFMPREYNVQVSLLKATIFALEGKQGDMGEHWRMAQYVAYGVAGNRVAGCVTERPLMLVGSGASMGKGGEMSQSKQRNQL
jgi:hypothetical protein